MQAQIALPLVRKGAHRTRNGPLRSTPRSMTLLDPPEAGFGTTSNAISGEIRRTSSEAGGCPLKTKTSFQLRTSREGAPGPAFDRPTLGMSAGRRTRLSFTGVRHDLSSRARSWVGQRSSGEPHTIRRTTRLDPPSSTTARKMKPSSSAMTGHGPATRNCSTAPLTGATTGPMANTIATSGSGTPGRRA